MQANQTNQTAEYPTSKSEAVSHIYNYWKNKPVNQFDETTTVSKNIEEDLSKRKVYGSDDPLNLPDSMKWVEVDTNDESAINSISKFLQTHYLVDDTGKFKLDYNPNFLKWAIGTNSISIAVVSKKNNAICGFVSANFLNMTVFESTQNFAVVDFLCAHPVYRGKKMVNVLIDEIVRRIVKSGVHQGCFTTSKYIPTPTSIIRIYHRPINYIKLQKYGFTDLEPAVMPNKKNPQKIQRLFNITGSIPHTCVPMTLEHLEQVYKAYHMYINRYNIYVNYTIDELKYYLLDTDNVKSFVELNGKNEVIDFFSFYQLDTVVCQESVEKNPIDKIYAWNLFLYTCNYISNSEFIQKALLVASKNNADVLNVTDTMIIPDTIYTKDFANDVDSDDESFVASYQHGFLKGSGKLNFNFFNWKCPEIHSKQLSWNTF